MLKLEQHSLKTSRELVHTDDPIVCLLH